MATKATTTKEQRGVATVPQREVAPERERLTERWRVDPGLARLFTVGLQAGIEDRLNAWLDSLQEGILTREMRSVFVGLGWLSSERDPRLTPITEPVEYSPDLMLRLEHENDGYRQPITGIEAAPPETVVINEH